MGWASLVGIVMVRDPRRVLVEQMRSAPTRAKMGANTIELGVMNRSSGRLLSITQILIARVAASILRERTSGTR